MAFPSSEREVFPRNVLKEVICQLRFPPILRIKTQAPSEFQELIRGRYPLYEEESPQDALPPDIADIVAGLRIRFAPADIIHKFLLADRSRIITLSPGFLGLSESNYISREKFLEQVEHAEREFRKEYTPAFYNRIGVRYKNVIDRTALDIPKKHWYELLSSQLLGELADPEIRDDVVKILTKVELRIDDIPESRVRITHGLATDEKEHIVYVLDADFFTTTKIGESHDVSRIVATFSDLNGRFFRWAIADELKDVLRG